MGSNQNSLMYVSMATHPDITYTTNRLSQFADDPGTTHWTAVQCVMLPIRHPQHRTCSGGANPITVMVCPLTPHVLLKPRLYPRQLNPFPKPFGSASDPPGSSAYVLFSFTDLHMFPILFLYLLLSIPLFTFQSPTLNPDVSYVSPVSDSVPA